MSEALGLVPTSIRAHTFVVPQDLTPEMRAVLLAIARKHLVTLDAMFSRSHSRTVVRARWDAWWVLYDEHGRSSVEIAMLWGMDHTSVLAALKSLRKQRAAT